LSTLLLTLFALCLAPASFAQNLPDLGDESQTLLSPLQERELGNEVMQQIRADPAYSDDSEVTDYLNVLGRRLVSASLDAHQEFNFFLILDPEINAFALPGGYVGVHSGLILAAQSESELAGVLGHEASHVLRHHIARGMAAQQRGQVVSMAAMVAALLVGVSGGSSDLTQAAIMGSQAGLVQNQLAYSRDFEREADRSGFQIMNRAGFDPQGMVSFFERLQKSTRFENAAPAYLRSHPLTYERIADMQNLAQDAQYRQVTDSIEFQLVRAKLRVMVDTPRNNVKFFEDSLNDKRYLSEAASRYGLATSLMLDKQYPRAKQELATLRKVVRANPMIEALAGQLYDEAGDTETSMDIYRNALKVYPDNRTLNYDYANMLLKHDQPAVALKLAEGRLRFAPTDYHLYEIQAKSYAALGKRTAQYRAQAENYYYRGNLKEAIQQLQLAQRSGDGDFYQSSSVEARLKEMQSQLPPDEDKDSDKAGQKKRRR
jgi:predicted Zn-dependent protease